MLIHRHRNEIDFLINGAGLLSDNLTIYKGSLPKL